MLQRSSWVNLESIAAQTFILKIETILIYVAAFEVIPLNNPSLGPGLGLDGSDIPFSGSTGYPGTIELDEAEAIPASNYSS